MPLEIPKGVEHSLSRFAGNGDRVLELAVVQATPNRLMGCNSFLDFGIGSGASTDSNVFRLHTQDGGGYTHYVAEINSRTPPLVFLKTVWSTVYQALMHAQQTWVDGMWINFTDTVAESIGLEIPGDCPIFFGGMLTGIKTYWMDASSAQTEAGVDSIVIGAGAQVHSALNGTANIAATVNSFISSGGVLKLV